MFVGVEFMYDYLMGIDNFEMLGLGVVIVWCLLCYIENLCDVVV